MEHQSLHILHWVLSTDRAIIGVTWVHKQRACSVNIVLGWGELSVVWEVRNERQGC